MKSERIESIDLMRGHYLIAMIIDHLALLFAPSVWVLYNGNGKLWVSAAEGFVFFAGLMVGLVYANNEKYKFFDIVRKFLNKALSLYSISVVFTLILSIFWWGKQIPLTGRFVSVVTQPSFFEITSAALLLQHRYGWVNILTLYITFFLITPLLVLLLRSKKVLPVLSLSVVLWLLAQLGVLRNAVNGIFDLFSWQILFVLGAIIGGNFEAVRLKISQLLSNRIVKYLLIACFFFLLTANIIYGNQFYIGDIEPFSKNTLGMGRLLAFPVWLYGTYVVLTTVLRVLPLPIKNFYMWFGQHSLQIYLLHAVILPLYVVVGIRSFGIIGNTIVIPLTLFIILVISQILSKQNRSRSVRPEL